MQAELSSIRFHDYPFSGFRGLMFGQTCKKGAFAEGVSEEKPALQIWMVSDCHWTCSCTSSHTALQNCWSRKPRLKAYGMYPGCRHPNKLHCVIHVFQVYWTLSLIIYGAKVESSPLLLRLFIDLLYQPWMIDADCLAISGMNGWQGKQKYSEKKLPQWLTTMTITIATGLPVTNRVSYGTACSEPYYASQMQWIYIAVQFTLECREYM
jgi:hypothetical protein